MREIHACRPWLDAELEAVRPDLIVCLGATAAQSLLGSSFKITKSRGEVQEVEGLPPPSLPLFILRQFLVRVRLRIERGTWDYFYWIYKKREAFLEL